MAVVQTVEEFLSPLDPSGFFQDLWEKDRFLFESIGFPIEFSCADFENLLNFGKLSYPQVMCYDSDGIVSPLAYTVCGVQGLTAIVDLESIATALYDRKTVRIADLPTVHPGIRELAQALSRLFGCHVNVNAYFSRGPCKGLRGHYDPHHVFALQLHGEKLWSLGDIVVDTPSKAYSPRTLVPPVITSEIATSRGQMLYIPPGMWHATATRDTSLHVTIGIHPPKWNSALGALLEHSVRQHPIIRASLPMALASGRCTYEEPSASDLKCLVGLLESEIENFVASAAPKRSPTPQVHLPSGPARESPVESLFQPNDEDTRSLIEEVWNLSNSPCSVYLRGSFPKCDQTHQPWDLDVYFVIHKREDTITDIASIRSILQSAHPDLPPVDLTIVTKPDLLSSPSLVLHRLLLHHDAVLVKGEPLKNKVSVPPLNAETALQIKAVMEPFLQRKVAFLRERATSGDAVELDALTKTIAKAALRSGSFIGVQSGRGFSRGIEQCAENITSRFPDIAGPVSVVLRRIQCDQYHLDEFVEAVESVRTRVYGA